MIENIRTRRVGVFVCHGMGQQVRYETVDEIAATIVRQHKPFSSTFRPHPVTNSAVAGGKPLARAELRLTDAEGRAHEVDLYEAYWAPLTEGKIGLIQTLTFLLKTGWGGLQYCVSEGEKFKRWMFQREHEYPIKPLTAIAVAAALAIVCMVYVDLLALVLSLPAALCFQICRIKQAAATLGAVSLWWLQACVWALVVGSFLLVSALALFALFQAGFLRKLAYSVIRRVNSLSVAFAIGLILAVCIAWPAPVSWLLSSSWKLTSALTDFLNGKPWIMMTTLPIAFWIWKQLNYFMVEFVGDVAIYVDAHSLDTFWDIRAQIKQVCLDVATLLYSDLKYDEIIIVGHSLGSVIAYDTLNNLIENDLLNGRKLGVIERTKHLITYGSPLDKIAFLFQAQTKNTTYRNQLNASLEPLVFHHRLRQNLVWTNVHATTDVISGELNYYDFGAEDPYCVQNVLDQDAPYNPAAAHTGYPERKALPKVLYAAVMGTRQAT